MKERKRRGPSDATDYSSTQAPATQEYAEDRTPLPSDERLQPGGPAGAPDDTGIGSLDAEGARAGRRATEGGSPEHHDKDRPQR